MARYFTDVRRFTLLNRGEERALWQRIEQAYTHFRRVLCTSPSTLPTLTRLWHQVALAEIPLEQGLLDAGTPADEQGKRREQFSESMVQLQELDTRLRNLRPRFQTPSCTPQQQRQQRQQCVRLWYQWIDIYERLELHSSVYKAIRMVLEVDSASRPWDRMLHVSHNARLRAHTRLEQVKAQMIRLKIVTYAHWWVRQAISRAITEPYRTVRLPNHIVERKNKVRRAAERLWGYTVIRQTPKRSAPNWGCLICLEHED
ncbi:RNA polymerase sigma factor RpoD [Candidatus Entotheonellaceae bacterium PAL068K]